MPLKLKIGNKPTGAPSGEGSTGQPTPTSATPTTATEPKTAGFKLKHSQPPVQDAQQATTPQDDSSAKHPKAGGAAKKGKGGGDGGGGSKKRTANDDISPAAKRAAPAVPGRKISLKPPAAPQPGAENGTPTSASGGLGRILLKQRKNTVPKLRQLNVKRPPPPRIPGVGYDSEDSDAEDDPAIQQAFILRMQPGEDCDYVREAIANGKIGVPPSEGPAEVSMRFLGKDFRRATVTVRGRMYAAALVDLPCIVETMKSWEKKNWWKVADLNQMLLVLGRCNSDEEARNYALPKEVDPQNMQYPHGLTPPMHWVRKRRFRKRLSYKTIENVEEEVERLLREDEECVANGGHVTSDVMGRAELEREEDPDQSMYDEDADADGEVLDTTENGYDEYDEGDIDLEGNLQAMFDADNDADATVAQPAPEIITTDSPAAMTDGVPALPTATDQSSTPAAAGTPAEEEDASTPAQPSATEGEESSGDEEDAGSEDGAEADDADTKAEQAERMQQLEEVNDLQREVDNQRRKVEGQKNQLLRERAAAQLRILEEDLRVKRGVMGIDEDGNWVEGHRPQRSGGGGCGAAAAAAQGGGDDGNDESGLFGDDDAEGESEEE